MALSYPPFANHERIRRAANNSPWMGVGERGSAVAILQAALIDRGYKMPISTKKAGVPDGIYGRETKQTVYQFQVDQKLNGKDGLAGRETFTRLDRLLATNVAPINPKPPKPPQPPPTRRDRNYMIGTGDPSIRPDPGAGAWNSTPTTATALVQKELILEILPPRGNSAQVLIGFDAARHMKHYMDNTGHTLQIRLEAMIDDVPTAKAHFQNEVSQAKRFVESLPVGTHQITSRSAESSYNVKSESWNWFFAVGGYSTWGKGTATVAAGSAAREYDLQFEYKFFDRYNWDAGKQVEIAGIVITDHFMGEFHRQGIAREFDMSGSIARRFTWRHGEAIPPQQYLPPGGR